MVGVPQACLLLSRNLSPLLSRCESVFRPYPEPLLTVRPPTRPLPAFQYVVKGGPTLRSHPVRKHFGAEHPRHVQPFNGYGVVAADQMMRQPDLVRVGLAACAA